MGIAHMALVIQMFFVCIYCVWDFSHMQLEILLKL